MPKRMPEKHRIRGKLRALVFTANIRAYGHLHCLLCDHPINDNPHVDHVIARERGGAVRDIRNCIPAHGWCNGRKCATDVAEVFGPAAAQRVAVYLANIRITSGDEAAASQIVKCGQSWPERIEMIHEWVEAGMLPLAPNKGERYG